MNVLYPKFKRTQLCRHYKPLDLTMPLALAGKNVLPLPRIFGCTFCTFNDGGGNCNLACSKGDIIILDGCQYEITEDVIWRQI